MLHYLLTILVSVLVTVLGGKRVSSWSPANGNLNWEVQLPGSGDKRYFQCLPIKAGIDLHWENELPKCQSV